MRTVSVLLFMAIIALLAWATGVFAESWELHRFYKSGEYRVSGFRVETNNPEGVEITVSEHATRMECVAAAAALIRQGARVRCEGAQQWDRYLVDRKTLRKISLLSSLEKSSECGAAVTRSSPAAKALNEPTYEGCFAVGRMTEEVR